MLDQRLRRWPDISLTYVERPVGRCSLIDRDDIIHTLTQPIITHIGCTMYTLSVIICTTTEYTSGVGGGGGVLFYKIMW